MKNHKTLILILVTALLAGLLGYSLGKGNKPQEEASAETADTDTFLQELNRSELENLVLVDGPIYVIGHKSPDSDTVCSAIAYAELLNKLGIEAKAMITEKPNNETAFILKEAGVETPEILYDASGLNIMLVDHSEYAQAADGMEDANIVGVIDHHGVGTIVVGHQLLYNAKPIGSTATSIWMTYLNYGVEMEQKTAHILLGAVLSDTDNLGGSTTINADREAVKALSAIAGVEDTDDFYKKLHAEKLSYEGFTEEEIIFSDYKEYEVSGVKFGIGLANAVDEEAAKALADRVAPAMPAAIKTRDVELMYISIRAENVKVDYIVCADEHSETVLKSAFPNYDEFDGTAYIFRSGLGRKTKFVPGLTEHLGAHPHE